MTYEQYWYGDVWLVEAFYKADRLRQERQNSEAWLQGMYFYEALSTALYNFGLEKGKPRIDYRSKPYEIDRPKTKAEIEKQEEEDAVFALAYMSSMVQNGKNWGKKKGG